MTNREKYIDKADIVDLYNLLDWQKIEEKFGITITGTRDIYKWLSQEAEEDNTEDKEVKRKGEDLSNSPKINRYVHFEEVKITIEDWNETIDRIRKLSERLDKLEKCNRTAEAKGKFRNATQEEKDCSYDYMLKTSKKNGVNIRDYDKSADEMFKELGYEKSCINDYVISYKKHGLTISITIDGEYTKYCGNKTVYEIAYITEAEDKAIHKKIEEIQKGEQDEWKRN